MSWTKYCQMPFKKHHITGAMLNKNKISKLLRLYTASIKLEYKQPK
jgi:hypothetical protein